MLETREERVKLLRAGLSEKEIERLYIEVNDIKIIHTPHIMKLVDIDISWMQPIAWSKKQLLGVSDPVTFSD